MPVDCVSYVIYTQQIDAVSRFMFMCYLRIHLVQYMHTVFHCLLNKFNSVSTFTIT